MDILITVAAVLFLMFSLKYFMQKKAQKAKGKSIDISKFNDEIKELLNNKKSILYFYTPTCGACRTQAPIIDKLKEDLSSVGKIDLSVNREAASEFGIMGTPTTAIMVGNNVVEIFVGLKKYDFLKSKYEAL
jgi:thiol-disulfide isomerase/thioredoxin